MTAAPLVASSRQFWLRPTGNELAAGIDIPITGGETLFRISRVKKHKSTRFSANAIQIQNNDTGKAIQLFSVRAASSDRTIVFKINTTPGYVNLKVDTARGKTPYVIHVLEKHSPYVLSLHSSSFLYAADQTIGINVSMLNLDKSINTSLQGYITLPDGRILGDLEFSQNGNGSYSANISAAGHAVGGLEGLFEAHVFAEGNDNGLTIRRDSKTAFGLILRTARFNGKLKATKQAIEFGIDVGVEAKYALKATLVGTNESGVMQELHYVSSGNWLQTGQQTLTLELNPRFIAESCLTAPYALKNISLVNLTYMAPAQTVKPGINLSGFDGFLNSKVKPNHTDEATKNVCEPEYRLSVQQVQDIKKLNDKGIPLGKIIVIVKAQNIQQVERVLYPDMWENCVERQTKWGCSVCCTKAVKASTKGSNFD